MDSNSNQGSTNEHQLTNLLNRKRKKSIPSSESTMREITDILNLSHDIESDAEETKRVAIDCEMVEVDKRHHGLCKVAVINEHGEVLLNLKCKPNGLITDYRYEITAITSEELEDAMDYEECRLKVINLIKDKIIIGHSLKNDLLSLNYEHQKNMIRDTAKFKKFQNNSGHPYSLKYLVDKFMKTKIQNSHHNPIEDARATLCLYKMFEEQIENEHLNKNHKLIRRRIKEDSKKMKTLFGI